ncbi:hypothetical protein [Microcoleus sp. PH2017_22_RUC_O_B]|uniref:hypothetical protein n=1 Tax=Microcoleus sp. PH2017_22_RUC_O_B TaxID=2798833 RepID=UPI0025E1868A|nr:hypothetical protein [Microcoleus sp. PH2017_22_RUC_O_B]
MRDDFCDRNPDRQNLSRRKKEEGRRKKEEDLHSYCRVRQLILIFFVEQGATS